VSRPEARRKRGWVSRSEARWWGGGKSTYRRGRMPWGGWVSQRGE